VQHQELLLGSVSGRVVTDMPANHDSDQGLYPGTRIGTYNLNATAQLLRKDILCFRLAQFACFTAAGENDSRNDCDWGKL
jgi:hypothetical protein